MNKLNVVYVDDERENLKAFKAAFRREFNIFLCESVDKATSILNQEDIHVIVSDHKMPKESGLSFFEKISKTHPEIMRILITAYGNFELVQDSINKGNVYRFLNKPWDEKLLQTTIEDAGRIFLLNRNNDNLRRAYFQLFDENPTPMIIIEKRHKKIVKVNMAAKSLLFDNNENDLADSSIQEVFGKHIKTDKIDKVQFLIKGKQYEFQLTPKEVHFDGEEYILLTIIDLSELLIKERERERLVTEIQQQERNYLSMEIHDGIGQEIVVLKLTAETLLHDCDQSKRASNELFINAIQDILKKARNLSFHLSPPELENGLISAVMSLITKVQTVSDIVYKTEISCFEHEAFKQLGLSKETNYQLYRVIQEFINNSIQHAKTSELIFSVNDKSPYIELEIKDNGIGFDIQQSTNGLGLRNIESRLKSNNIDYELSSELGKGTSLLMRFKKSLTLKE